MVLETLIGGALGGVLRLVPEIMNLLDKKSERSHELAMFDKQLEADKIRSEQRIAEAQASGAITLDQAGLQALTEAIKGQSQLTGNWLVDSVNMLMRPVITIWFVLIMNTAAKLAQFWLLLQDHVLVASAMTMIWTEGDAGIVAGIINFWFLDRVIRKRQGV